MEIRLTLGRKNRLLDSSFSKRQVLGAQLGRLMIQGNPKTDFLESYKPNLHFAELQR